MVDWAAAVRFDAGGCYGMGWEEEGGVVDGWMVMVMVMYVLVALCCVKHCISDSIHSLNTSLSSHSHLISPKTKSL